LPDGKKILFSGSEGKASAIKSGNILDPPALLPSFYSFYDIATRHQDKIMEGTDKEDYSAHGWLDDQT